jgi:hypothetical protein
MNKCAIIILAVGMLLVSNGDSFFTSQDSDSQYIEYKRPMPEQLRQASINLIRRHGTTSFLDELHRLIGYASEVKISQTNVEMFSDLGFRYVNKQVPFTIAKSTIHKVFRDEDYDFTINTIHKAILAADNVNLDKPTIWFLEWALTPSRRLNSTLVRDEVMGIGWNSELYSSVRPRVPWVTFGAYHCTVILAEGADGAWSGSHYDTAPYNPKQIATLDKFSILHGGLRRIYLINWRPDHIRILSEKWPETELLIADKSERDIWFIHFCFENGSVIGRYSRREASAEWLGSLSPKNQVVDFRKSLLSFMIPRPETEWKEIKFEKAEWNKIKFEKNILELSFKEWIKSFLNIRGGI